MPQPSLESPKQHLPLARWLLVVASLVFLLIIVDGITRLSATSLQITNWKSQVYSFLPPLSDADWTSVYDHFRLSEKLPNLSLEALKSFYLWCWLQHLLSKLLSFAFMLPVYWLSKKKTAILPLRKHFIRLLILLLIHIPLTWCGTSHICIAADLLVLFALLAGLCWTMLDLHLIRKGQTKGAGLTWVGTFSLSSLFFGLLMGALMAGLKAGHVSNTWPLMFGKIIPPGIEWNLSLLPNLPDHAVALHFLHRWWAWVIVAILSVLARCIRKTNRKASVLMHSAFGTQFLIGIAAVLTDINFAIALSHQVFSALTVVTTIWCVHIHGSMKATVD